MTAIAVWQLLLYMAVLLALVKPLGWYMAQVYEGKPAGINRWLAPLERGLYKLCGIAPGEEMSWRKYTAALLLFNLLGFLAVYGLQRFQHALPLNPENMPAVSVDSSFNTASSFVSNTNWQGYAGEATMSYLTQMLGLAVQNFFSAATGMAVLVALARGFSRRSAGTLGNAWVDLTRSTLYILLPLSVVLALALVSQGVVQSFSPYQRVATVEQPASQGSGEQASPQKFEQVVPLGPVASQIAIKQLGTNGGGYFNANSAHPLENPTPFSNFLEVLAILLIPAALCYTFGRLIGDVRQGWALLAAMTFLFVALLVPCVLLEQGGTPQLSAAGADLAASDTQAGGNMEGKETRFGITSSAQWAVVTTAASNGSVNAMHDSFTPLGGLIPMWLMQLGEVVYGGVGSGLYGMLIFAVVAVFIAGLMIGRTPEYLGKKIEAFEVKMATIVILVPVMLVLFGTALAVLLPAGLASRANPGPHGFSEILYAYSSAGNNNGSAFAGISANVPFYNYTLGLAMLIGRFGILVPVLAIAGALARKKQTPPGAGTLPTHTPLFVVLLISVVVIVGALSFIPALALGPIVEHFLMWN